MTKEPIFTGAAVAIITPMNADGSVNYAEFAKFVDWQIENGTDAVVICGTTGESSTLRVAEHLECIKWCVDYVAGRCKVIAGTGSNSTQCAIEMSVEACEYGADALLLVTPYYNKTSQRGLVVHYTAIHDATDKPIILYNVPSRTGLNIQPETAFELSKLPRINGIKEASGNLAQIARVHELCSDSLNIWSGNDDQIFDIMQLGGKGVISVLSNVCPAQTHEIVQKYIDGDVVGSKAMMDKYMKLAKNLFCDVNPIPVKDAVNMIGFAAGPCRLPLVELSAENKKLVSDTLAEYGLI
ncbi:MAG: 4-hydroxy-tetrahydrodipicolinate synthase [Clostridiales bacterium]|nr:4-hydroxy-tetrahydrodipicolinate synthase [Clostridiales bacterium]